MSTAESIPLVSVLMPVFNTSRYLDEALRSVQVQTFADFELIVVDDGSTDGSSKVLQAFAAREPRMRLITRENRGLIATRNELLAAARGELLAWMDSDDISLPDRFARQVEAFRSNPQLVCLGSAAQCIDPEGHYLKIEYWPTSPEQILIEQQSGGAMRFPTTMMRRDPALSVGGFREPFKIGEDFDFLLRLSSIGELRNFADVLYLYRQHVASVCATMGAHWQVYRDQVLELARERRLRGTDRLQEGGSIHIALPKNFDRAATEWQVYRSWAEQALDNGNIALAFKYARVTLVRRPLAISAWKLLGRILVRTIR
jgi:glycosyltransferase involved in cell wall biosynthesis